MALPKKGLRTITVENYQFVWSAKSDNYGGFHITISSSKREGQILNAWIDIISSEGRILIVTNYIIRQIILLGFVKGWTPNEEKSPLSLKRVNEEIDLNGATYWNPQDNKKNINFGDNEKEIGSR